MLNMIFSFRLAVKDNKIQNNNYINNDINDPISLCEFKI